MDARTKWLKLLSGEAGGPLIDIGASTLTAVEAPAGPLTAAEAIRLGSDCVRAGFAADALSAIEGELAGALENAGLAEIARHPRPIWPSRIEFPEPDGAALIVVADAPCPGLLDMCFALRDRWRFLNDIVSDWRAASALLDWSLETIASAYESMLGALPRPPDIVIYADDYGFDRGMFISGMDFRTFIRPRLRMLLSRLRRATPAAICLHSCGAVRPIMGDLADLGVELLNFDGAARDMDVAGLRRDLPRGVAFHGVTDLVALGRAADAGDFAILARLAVELADSLPAIAAPTDRIDSPGDLASAARGAAFVKSLSEENWDALRRIGPVKPVIEAARRGALGAELPDFINKTRRKP